MPRVVVVALLLPLPGRFYGPAQAESYDPAFHLINFTGAAVAAAAVAAIIVVVVVVRGRPRKSGDCAFITCTSRRGAMKNAVFAVA